MIDNPDLEIIGEDIPKSRLKIKLKKLYNEYVLTNKHIICKFKYLIVAFDKPDNMSLSGGLVALSKAKLEELITDQNITLTHNKEKGYWKDVINELKEWHPQISKIELDCKVIHDIDNLSDYETFHQTIKDQIKLLSNNNCIKSDEDFEIFKKLSHKAIDIKVYFQLTRKISNITEYNVNFNYLHKLLHVHILKWTLEDPIFLDEAAVNIKYLPYADKLNYSCDEDDDICYVYPSVYLLPLLPIED